MINKKVRINKKRNFYADKVVLITGASSGIGKALSLKLVNYGAIVFGVSRSIEKLQNVADESRDKLGKFIPFKADVSSYEGCSDAFNGFKKEFPRLDILINNAGIGHFSPFEKMDRKDYEYILNTNILAPMHLLNLFIGLIKKSDNGRIINICSSGAFYGIPYRSVYCASKAGMRAWSQAISIELNRFSIEVLTIIPGSTQTNFFDNSLGRAPETHRLPGRIMLAEELAEIILTKAMDKSGEYIVSLPSRVVLFVSAFVPAILKKVIQCSVVAEGQHLYNKP